MEYKKQHLVALLLLRFVIGWHFFYEGMIKVLNPDWSSKFFLLDSAGFLKPFFHWLASNSSLLVFVDWLNAWGLTLIGLALLLGLMERISSLAGIILLALYYFSHPPFPGLSFTFPVEGSYFLVNKILIEMVALYVIYSFPTAKIIGLERLIKIKSVTKL